jgi:hypothetical protein
MPDYVEPSAPREPNNNIRDTDSLGTMGTLSTFDGSLDLGDLTELEKAMVQDKTLKEGRGPRAQDQSPDQYPAPPPVESSARPNHDTAKKFDKQASKAEEMLGEMSS